VPEIIEFIKGLIKKDFTYEVEGNVYFDVSKFPTYSELSKACPEKLIVGAHVEVDKNKRNSRDFALRLYKSKIPNQVMQWDSPWDGVFQDGILNALLWP